MGTCLKQVVTCVLTDESTGVSIEAQNQCNPAGAPKVCPRVTAKCKSGEDYHLCGPPVHAEEAVVRAAMNAGMRLDGSTVRVYGHDYVCDECFKLLTEVGVGRILLHGKVIYRREVCLQK